MSRKRFEDDGRRVASMDELDQALYGRKIRPQGEHPAGAPEQTPEYRRETRRMAWRALLLTLAVASVFLIGFALFILFCQFVWLR